MKCSSYRLRAFVTALAWCLTLAVSLSAAPVSKDRDKEKEREGKPVDAGSFGIYQNGNRVGTETFSIYPVSYTHLDVYKRQVHARSVAARDL